MSDTVDETIERLGGTPAFCERFYITRQAVRRWRVAGEFPGHLYFPMSEWAAEKGVELDAGLFHFERKPRRRKADNGATTQD